MFGAYYLSCWCNHYCGRYHSRLLRMFYTTFRRFLVSSLFVSLYYTSWENDTVTYFWHMYMNAAAVAKSLQSCPTLCDPIDGSPPGSPIPGFSRQEHWSGLPFPSPMHESEKWKWSRSVMSDPQQPHELQPSSSSIHGIFQARVLEWGAMYMNRWSFTMMPSLLLSHFSRVRLCATP